MESVRCVSEAGVESVGCVSEAWAESVGCVSEAGVESVGCVSEAGVESVGCSPVCCAAMSACMLASPQLVRPLWWQCHKVCNCAT